MLNKEILFEQLDQNTDDAMTLLKNVSADDLLKHPDNKWSVIQIMEHILLTDQVVIILIQRTPKAYAEQEELHGRERLHKFVVTHRNRTVEAPSTLHPKGNIQNFQDFSKVFLQQRDQLKNQINSGQIALDNAIHQHPYLGDMTTIDWLHFISLHTQRHLEQIKEILGFKATE